MERRRRRRGFTGGGSGGNTATPHHLVNFVVQDIKHVLPCPKVGTSGTTTAAGPLPSWCGDRGVADRSDGMRRRRPVARGGAVYWPAQRDLCRGRGRGTGTGTGTGTGGCHCSCWPCTCCRCNGVHHHEVCRVCVRSRATAAAVLAVTVTAEQQHTPGRKTVTHRLQGQQTPSDSKLTAWASLWSTWEWVWVPCLGLAASTVRRFPSPVAASWRRHEEEDRCAKPPTERLLAVL